MHAQCYIMTNLYNILRIFNLPLNSHPSCSISTPSSQAKAKIIEPAIKGTENVLGEPCHGII